MSAIIIQFPQSRPINAAVAYLAYEELKAVMGGHTGRPSPRHHPAPLPLPGPGRIPGISSVAAAAENGILRGPKHKAVRHRALSNASAALDLYEYRADSWLRMGGDADDTTELDVADARDGVQRLELACDIADADGLHAAAREWFAMAGRLRVVVTRLEQSLGR